MNQKPTLESAVQAFNHWRAHRQKRSRIPAQLKEMAVALQSHHPQTIICSKLRINPSALKSWAVKDEQAFVNLPLTQPPASSTSKASLSLTFANGGSCQLEGEFDAHFIAQLIFSLQRGALQ